jgi:hypothetical protein
MSIFGKIFDVVGDFGSNIYNTGKDAVMGFGSNLGSTISSGTAKTVSALSAPFTGGIGESLSTFGRTAGNIGNIISAGSAIGNLVSDKDSGQGSPLGAFTGLQGAPNPVANTSGTGTGNSANLLQFGTAPNASGQSFFPNAPIENQSGLIETNQSSLGSLVPFGTGLAGQAFQIAKPYLTNKTSQAIGLLGGLATQFFDDDKEQTTTLTGGSPMAFGVGGQGALTIPQTMPMMQGSAFMSPVLGRIGISSKGNIIITRRLKNQFKALADNVGLAQASNLAGVPLEIGAMILTKRFATRGKSISTKKMQECARTYKRITNFYNMIPRRTATRTTRAKSMRGASTVIQNS